MRVTLLASLLLATLHPFAHAEEIPVVVSGQPVSKAHVVLLYVDGLRPDVVHTMAQEGLLPNIQQIFIDGGLEFTRVFTTFPSNTLTANGALFTGRFPDRTGIKSQNQFERTTRIPTGQLSEWIPDWLLRHQRFGPRISDLLDKFAPENTYRFLQQRGIPMLDTYLGKSYQFTILPIAPLNPPPLWVHRAFNAIEQPWAASHRIPHELDRINARYMIEELIGEPEARVIAAWFPMVDKISHHSPRGQFGEARSTLMFFDRMLGKMVRRIHQVGWGASTYLFLVSDHGHVGGETGPNQPASLVEGLFHRQLGCNVKVVGKDWIHPGMDPNRFVFIDHQAWGQASIFLPKGAYHTGAWQRNSLAELMAYDVGPNHDRVNVLEALGQFEGVDLVVVKLDASRILVRRALENQAVIHLETDEGGTERYRYEPAHSDEDPLGYLRDPTIRDAVAPMPVAQWMAAAHSAEEWLRVSAETEYPDAIVGMVKFFGWEPPVEELADNRDPDVVVTAARGWSFRTDGEQGTDHGAPLREAMRITCFLAGPSIRRGESPTPHRIIDLMPTILTMVGVHYPPESLDGKPFEGIYDANNQ